MAGIGGDYPSRFKARKFVEDQINGRIEFEQESREEAVSSLLDALENGDDFDSELTDAQKRKCILILRNEPSVKKWEGPR